ncbi:MAG: GtrA family protein [Propionibacteriaceae bacterium]|nr:GtrA family protein [Propionibacteriaceae bacterium]
MRRGAATFGRFLFVGVANTLVTGALLSALSLVIPPTVAYPIVFVLGIAFSVILAGTFVFRSRFTAGRVAWYVVGYLAIFGIGLGCIHLMELAGWPPWTSGSVVLVTAPLGFLVGKAAFGGRSSASS